MGGGGGGLRAVPGLWDPRGSAHQSGPVSGLGGSWNLVLARPSLYPKHAVRPRIPPPRCERSGAGPEPPSQTGQPEALWGWGLPEVPRREELPPVSLGSHSPDVVTSCAEPKPRGSHSPAASAQTGVGLRPGPRRGPTGPPGPAPPLPPGPLRLSSTCLSAWDLGPGTDSPGVRAASFSALATLLCFSCRPTGLHLPRHLGREMKLPGYMETPPPPRRPSLGKTEPRVPSVPGEPRRA